MAHLRSERFSLDLKGDRRGGIGVAVFVATEYTHSIRLNFEFTIDQSYLPPIIQSVEREFPFPTRSGRFA